MSKAPIICELVGVYYDEREPSFFGSSEVDFIKSKLDTVVVQDEPVHKIHVGVV